MHPQPCQRSLWKSGENALWRTLAAEFTRRWLEAVEAPERLTWAVWVRWLVIGGFFGLAMLAYAAGVVPDWRPCLAAAVAVGTVNGVTGYCLDRRWWVGTVSAVGIGLDQLVITFVVASTGGTASPFVLVYVVQVLTTAMLRGTLPGALSAGWAITQWLVLIVLQATGVLVLAAPPVVSPLRQQITWTAFLIYSLGLLTYVGGHVAKRLRASELDLAARNLELSEALGSLRAAYAQLQAAELRLVQGEKMRSLGTLVAGVAHEINNPVAFISANVEHLGDYFDRLQKWAIACAKAVTGDEAERLAHLRQELKVQDAVDDLPQLLDDCREGARRTKRIVDDLRQFSRGGPSERWQLCDVEPGINATLGLLRPRLSRIEVHRDYGVIPSIEVMSGQLNQVFMNVLANAIEAIGERDGNIWIATRLAPEAGDGWIAIEMRDDGCGMSPDIVGRLGEPFFTTKETGEGTGLGLGICHGIVARHGGAIRWASELGSGTTCTVTLPSRRPPQRPPESSAAFG